jgi:glycosyltransferase involved in cell wall biosynthesis
VISALRTPFTTIENGYDATKWYCDTPKKPCSFLTVCGGLQFSFQYQLKGIDLYVQAAKVFPAATFTIVGVPEAYTISDAPPNLILIGNTANEKLRAIYSQHQFYVQLSMAEGFPNSLCEAMLCECVPVGSAVFSIPEIISDTGFVLPHRDKEELKALLTKAMQSDTDTLGKAARRRIAERYTEYKRREKLLALVERL